MHAWLCENPVGVDALQWKELTTPQPKAGEVLIEIKAASASRQGQCLPALPAYHGPDSVAPYSPKETRACTHGSAKTRPASKR